MSTTTAEIGKLSLGFNIDENSYKSHVDRLVRSLTSLEDEAKKTAAILEKIFDKINAPKIQPPNLSPVEQAFKDLGVTSQKELNEAAEKARQAFRTISTSGEASAEDVQRAYKAMQREVAKASEGITKQSSIFEGLGRKLGNLGNSLESTGTRLSIAITAPLALAARQVIKTGSDFESAFAGVRKTVNATEPQLQIIRDAIRNMAKDMPASAAEIAKVGEAAGQLGIKTEHILSFAKVMTDLGVTTNLSSDQAATALARLANITQMPQENFDRLGATVTALGNAGASTESEIVEMGLRIAGAGKQANLTEAQILAFANALSSVGIEAEAGGTAISRVFLQMKDAVQSGGKQLEIFAKVAGLSAAEFKQAFERDAATAAISFIEGLGKISAAGNSLTPILAELELNEIRVRDALLRASSAGDLFRESLVLGSKAWEENTALTKEAGERYKTFDSQLQIVKNRISDLGITLFDTVRPALMSGLDTVKQWIDKIPALAAEFTKANPVLTRFSLSALGLAAISGPVLVSLGAIVSFLGGPFTAALLAAGGSFAALVVGYLSNVAHLQDVTNNLVATLTRDWKFFGSETGNTFTFVEKVIGGFVLYVSGMATAVIQAINVMTSGIRALLKALTLDFEGAWKDITDIGNFGGRNTTEGVKEGLSGTPKAVASIIADAENRLRAAAQRFGAIGAQAGANFARGLAGVLNAGKPNTIGQGGKGIMGINQFFGGMSELTEAERRNAAAMAEAGKRIAASFGNGFKDGAKGSKKQVEDIAFESVSRYLQIIEKGVQLSKKIWDSLAATTRAALIPLGADLAKTEAHVERLNAALIAAGSKLRAYMEGTKGVIKQSTDAIIENINHVGQATAQLQIPFKQSVIVISEASSKAKAAAQQMSEDIQREFKEMLDEMRHLFGAPLAKVIQGIVNQFGNLSTELGKKINAIGRVMATLPDALGGRSLNKILNEINQWVSFVSASIDLVVDLFGKKLPTGVKDTLDKVRDVLSGGAVSAQQSMQKMGESVKLAVDEMAKAVVQEIKQMVADIKKELGQLPQTGTTTGSQLANNFLGGVSRINVGLVPILAGVAGQFGGMAGKCISAIALVIDALGRMDDSMVILNAVGANVQSFALTYSGAMNLVASSAQNAAHQVTLAYGQMAAAQSGAAVGTAAGKGGLLGNILKGLGVVGIGLSVFSGIKSLFSGKSEAEKAQEAAQIAQSKEAIKQASLQTARMAADLEAALADTAIRLKEMFDRLHDTSRLDKSAFRAFFKNLRSFTQGWIDELKRFAKEDLNMLKESGEAIQPSIEAAVNSLDFFDRLTATTMPQEQSIRDWGASLDKLITVVEEVLSEYKTKLLKSMAKRSKFVSEIVGLGSESADFIANASQRSLSVSASNIKALGASLKLSIDELTGVLDSLDNTLLKRNAPRAERAQTILGLISSYIEPLIRAAQVTEEPRQAIKIIVSSIRFSYEELTRELATIDAALLAETSKKANNVAGVGVLLNTYIDPILKAVEIKDEPREQIRVLTSSIRFAVQELIAQLSLIDQEALAAADEKAGKASGILALFGAAADPLIKAQQITEMSISKIASLADAAKVAVLEFIRHSKEIDAGAIEGASAQASAMSAILGVFNATADMLVRLGDSKAATIGQVTQTINGYGTWLKELVRVAREVTPDLMAEALTFSRGMIEIIMGLDTTHKSFSLIADSADDPARALRQYADGFDTALNIMSGLVSKALAFRGLAESFRDAVMKAVEAFKQGISAIVSEANISLPSSLRLEQSLSLPVTSKPASGGNITNNFTVEIRVPESAGPMDEERLARAVREQLAELMGRAGLGVQITHYTV